MGNLYVKKFHLDHPLLSMLTTRNRKHDDNSPQNSITHDVTSTETIDEEAGFCTCTCQECDAKPSHPHRFCTCLMKHADEIQGLLTDPYNIIHATGSPRILQAKESPKVEIDTKNQKVHFRR